MAAQSGNMRVIYKKIFMLLFNTQVVVPMASRIKMMRLTNIGIVVGIGLYTEVSKKDCRKLKVGGAVTILFDVILKPFDKNSNRETVRWYWKNSWMRHL